jgi:monothiol glutaredoxin
VAGGETQLRPSGEAHGERGFGLTVREQRRIWAGMDSALRERIQTVIGSNPVVLFMKGTRTAPQCGFSATVVQLLDSVLEDYATVNVLADAEIRQGIKDFSEWPTIPQLYVKGEFLGGCDIIKDLHAQGQLEESLGMQGQEITPPAITISEGAAAAFKDALEGGEEFVRLEISPEFEHALSIGPRGERDLLVPAGPLSLLVDRGSARRAGGVSID